MKKIIYVLIICLIFVSETKCYAENTKESNEIDICIKEFVSLFENIDNEESIEKIMKKITDISVDTVNKTTC